MGPYRAATRLDARPVSGGRRRRIGAAVLVCIACVGSMLSAGQVITNACMHSSEANGWKTLSHSQGVGGLGRGQPPLGLSAACVALRCDRLTPVP